MNTVLWVFLLCMPGYLITHTLDCADGDMDCDSGLGERVKLRFLRQTNSDHERGAQQSQANLPGAFTAKGFPNTLIQADRSRRHLNRRPLPPRSRVGSYSLLSHKTMSPLQVVRARRHAGVAADPAMPSRMTVKQRPRSVTRKTNTKVAVCS
ncbi:uncharacterized protein si:dkey-12l12.1 [Ictalurus furcatus]|uniref:uncharacterized protein si:dkey-12l12.1 n=1 Tax=Ictalurus furcatus TaxID=66913 RepID=UPI00235036DE|nr:uncharacterized protein si:dkey-12l12.1 [Ictalurus furcatus]